MWNMVSNYLSLPSAGQIHISSISFFLQILSLPKAILLPDSRPGTATASYVHGNINNKSICISTKKISSMALSILVS